MSGMGRTLIILGMLLIAAGIVISFFPRLLSWLGRLPGDITIRRNDFSFHFPLATCLLISALLSFILWLFRR
jgi:uncharacterized protein HemY